MYIMLSCNITAMLQFKPLSLFAMELDKTVTVTCIIICCMSKEHKLRSIEWKLITYFYCFIINLFTTRCCPVHLCSHPGVLCMSTSNVSPGHQMCVLICHRLHQHAKCTSLLWIDLPVTKNCWLTWLHGVIGSHDRPTHVIGETVQSHHELQWRSSYTFAILPPWL